MLKNKNIVITGATGGIGRAIVNECAKNHANVWALLRKVDDDTKMWIEELKKENNVEIKPVIIDFLDRESIREAASKIIEEKISIDGIVNNAGVVGNIELFSMTRMDDIKETFEINFFGPMEFTQRLLKRLMRQKKGSIVNISSIASLDGEPGQFAYVSSKAAINGATKKLSNELAPFNIRVNAIAPGMVDTNMLSNMTEELKMDMLNKLAIKRLAKPEEIGKLCTFLLSDNSEFITGQIIRIDGGR
ncbi:SDR family NAD(P)-dependent oxidoreductase [Lachnospira multipara]|uniref:SDR family NAD(P)-dependent oxidoreductase n=1 Tax=Lachnospira multipara TaxID=28051 RepID=UPI0004E18A68|nr:SDR family oxidoreductase [Lachnospira multipara]